MRLLLGVLFTISSLFSATAEEVTVQGELDNAVLEETAPENGKLSKLAQGWEMIKTTLTNACADKKECLDQVVLISKIVWENRDRRDIHKHIAICSATVAYNKGYVLNPKKMWTDMNAELAKSTALEVCVCVTDKWRNSSNACEVISDKIPTATSTIIASSEEGSDSEN